MQKVVFAAIEKCNLLNIEKEFSGIFSYRSLPNIYRAVEKSRIAQKLGQEPKTFEVAEAST